MTGSQKHVLLWVAPEFLQSKGMLRILEEVGAIGLKTGQADEITEAAVRAGGFAISGALIDANHGAGIWISPGESENLQLMIPWGFVRCSVMAETPKSAKIFGLAADLAVPTSGSSPHA
jgi:hypothetical protein